MSSQKNIKINQTWDYLRYLGILKQLNIWNKVIISISWYSYGVTFVKIVFDIYYIKLTFLYLFWMIATTLIYADIIIIYFS